MNNFIFLYMNSKMNFILTSEIDSPKTHIIQKHILLNIIAYFVYKIVAQSIINFLTIIMMVKDNNQNLILFIHGSAISEDANINGININFQIQLKMI